MSNRTAVCVAATLICLAAASVASAQGHWQVTHGDLARTGTTNLPGDITRPAVSWQASIGNEAPTARVRVADITGDGNLEYLTLVEEAVVARNSEGVLLWDTPPLGTNSFATVADFDGDARPEILLVGRLVVLLDGRTGQIVRRITPDDPNKLSFRAPTVIPVNVDDDPEMELVFGAGDKIFQLYDFSQGFNAAPVWTNNDAALPTAVVRPVIGDFDGVSTTREIAIVNQTFCQIVFLSLADGQTLRVSASLTNGLYCYGLYQGANLDSDDQDEMIFTGVQGISNGSVGITVYDYVDDAVQWQYEYENNAGTKAGLSPSGVVVDLDGDNALEVVTAVYNNTAESGPADDGLDLPDQWAVAIYDAATGATLGSLSNRTIVGLEDVDHDGTTDLITRSTLPGQTEIPAVGDVEVWSLEAGRTPVMRYSVPSVTPILQAFGGQPDISSRDYNSVPALFDLNNDGDGHLLVASNDGNVTTLQAMDFEGGNATIAASSEVPGETQLTLIQTGSGLIEQGNHAILRDTLGGFRVYNNALTATERLSISGHTSPVLAVDLLAGPTRQLIYRKADGSLAAFDPTGANPLTPPTELWSVPNNGGDFVAFDRDNDGIFEVVYSSVDNDGTPYVEMLSAQGQSLWRTPLPDAAFGLFSMVFGNFGGADDTVDIAGLSFLNNNNAVVWTLDGSDGTINARYEPDPNEVRRFPNREILVDGDLNNDGADDLILLHYTSFERLSGTDLSRIGDILLLPNGNARPANSTLLRHNGTSEIFMKPFASNNLLLDAADGTARWAQPLPASLFAYVANFPGQADANGDGNLDVAVPGLLGDLTVYSGADGAVLYRLCLNDGTVTTLDADATLESCVPIAPVSSVVTGDVDGDNAPEFVVGDAAGWLYALNVADGSVSWALDLQARVRFPMLTDTDGDGNLEIAITTSRSELVVVDQAEITPVAAVRDVALDGDNNIVDADADIAQTARTDAFAAAWDAAPRADSYVVSLLTSNDTEVVGRTNVGNVTEFVFENLSLVPGVTYVVNVVAISDALGAAPAAVSNGALVVGGPPTISGLSAEPNPLTLNIGQTTELTALVSADGATLLTDVTLRITNAADELIREAAFTPNVTNFNVNFVWNGTDSNDADVPTGQYTVTVSATDAIGESTSENISVTVREPGDPIISDLTADPESFNPFAGQTTTISATINADAAVSLAEVSLQLLNGDDEVVFEELYAPDTTSFSLRTLWDGNDQDNALVDPGQYTAQIRATDSLDNTSTASVNVTVTPPGAPTISAFEANPDAFDPAAGQSTELTAQVSATGPIESVNLLILSPNDAIILEEDYAPDADTFSLQTAWNGTDSNDALVPAGEYLAQLTVEDVFGNSAGAELTITVVPPGEVSIANFEATPDTFDVGLGQSTTVTANISAGNIGLLEEVVLEIRDSGDALVQEQTFNPAASTFGLQTTWDGTDADGELVDAGDYRLVLRASNDLGSEADDAILVTVVVTEEPEEDTGNNMPDAGDMPDGDDMPDAGDMLPDADDPNVRGGGGDGCSCATPNRPTRAPAGALLMLALAALAIVRRKR